MDEPKTLTMIVRLPGTPEQAFDAWTKPELARQWLLGTPGSDGHTAQMDPVVGGRWQISDIRKGKTYVAEGEYLVVDRPRALSFTAAMPQFSPNADILAIALEADGAETVMTFTQSGPDIAEELAALKPGKRSASESGWSRMFRGLAEVIEGRVPKMHHRHHS
jgi:uncharacterized protein YndB with AHSA1/START domain